MLPLQHAEAKEACHIAEKRRLEKATGQPAGLVILLLDVVK